MSWFSRGCCALPCIVCSGAPDEFVVDFGVGGWTDNAATWCDELAGEVTVGNKTAYGLCSGNYDCPEGTNVSTICCAYDGPISADDFPRLFLINGGVWGWWYVLIICAGAEDDVSSKATFMSSAWSSTNCLYGADPVTGKIALTKMYDVHISYGLGIVPCVGSFPATIDMWAA